MQLFFLVNNQQQYKIAGLLFFFYSMWLTYNIVKRGSRKKVTLVQKTKIYGVVFFVVFTISTLTILGTVSLSKQIYDSFDHISVGMAINVFMCLVAIVLLLMLFGGVALYAMGYALEKYKSLTGKVFLRFIVPLFLLLLDVFFILTLFSKQQINGKQSIAIYVILLVFIIAITMMLVAFVKSIWFSKETGKNKKKLR